MKVSKINYVIILLLVLISCEKETPAEQPVSGEVILEVFAKDMTTLHFKAQVNVINYMRIEQSGINLYDKDMKLISTKNIPIKSNAFTLSDSIVELERGKEYQIEYFIIDYLSNEVKSELKSVKTHSFELTNILYNNYLDTNRGIWWYTNHGVLSGDEIVLIGNHLNGYDENCKILLNDLSDVTHFIKQTDNRLILYLDSTINASLFKSSAYESCNLYVLEDYDTIADFKITVFSDKPLLKNYDAYSGSTIELYGRMANDGLDSLKIVGVTSEVRRDGYGSSGSFYYHQRWSEHYTINPALESGTYTFIAYLNGYTDSLSVEIP